MKEGLYCIASFSISQNDSTPAAIPDLLNPEEAALFKITGTADIPGLQPQKFILGWGPTVN